MCEMFTTVEDKDENLTWTPVKITGQILRRKDPKDVHIRLRILWLNGQTSWIRLEDFQLSWSSLLYLEWSGQDESQMIFPFGLPFKYENTFNILFRCPILGAILNLDSD